MTEDTETKLSSESYVYDFIKDWQVNKKDESAIHQSGIGFKYISNGEDGQVTFEILNMPQWFQKEISEGQSFSECKKKLAELRNQFVTIYKETIVSSNSISQLTSKGIEYER